MVGQSTAHGTKRKYRKRNRKRSSQDIIKITENTERVCEHVFRNMALAFLVLVISLAITYYSTRHLEINQQMTQRLNDTMTQLNKQVSALAENYLPELPSWLSIARISGKTGSELREKEGLQALYPIVAIPGCVTTGNVTITKLIQIYSIGSLES